MHARNYLLAKGIDREDDFRCRAADKTDFTVRYDGATRKGESKTGAGSWKFTKVDWTEDDIFPGIDLFVIAAETEFLTEENFMDQLWVATREQYIAMLTYTGKKGIRSSLNFDAKRGLMKIQPYVTKVNDKKTGKALVEVDPKYFRPAEVDQLLGNPAKAKAKLGWNPHKTSFEELVKIMVKHDMKFVKKLFIKAQMEE